MRVVSKEEMERIDRETISEFGIPGLILMENAGIAMSVKSLEIYPELKTGKVSVGVLVGPGNNGGDGLVMARWYFINGIEVRVYLFGDRGKFKGDPLVNLNIADKLCVPMTEIKDIEEWKSVRERVMRHGVLVDALFGTGLNGEVRGFFRELIEDLNSMVTGIRRADKNMLRVLSVDVPSGLLCVEDKQNKSIVRADDTITVALPKLGMVDYPGLSCVGRRHEVQIGFPESLLAHERLKRHLICSETGAKLMPSRPKDSHKGTFGHLLVIGGSRQYAGAAVLASHSALKSGCGLVSLASVASVCQTMRMHLPEVICVELPEEEDGTISDKAFNILEPELSRYEGIVMGPGLGNNPLTGKLMASVLAKYQGKLLIDADGLNFLAENKDMLKMAKSSVIVTPHIKEMSRLVQKTVQDVKNNKIAFSRDFSKAHNVILVLKDAVTLISEPQGHSFYNTTGNEGMATGGSGDVLAGLVGGLMVNRLGVLESSVLGVYIHGLAGDHAKRGLHSASLTATDIINHIYIAFNSLSAGENHV